VRLKFPANWHFCTQRIEDGMCKPFEDVSANGSKWHVRWMRMFRRCFPFIVTVPKVPKDQREVGTSDHWAGACSRMLQHSWPSHCRSGHFLHKQKHKDLNILTDSPSERFFKSKKGVHPKSIGMLNFGTDPSGDSCPIFHQPILGDIAMVSLQHSNLGKNKYGCSHRTNRTQ
jgi:hypothetical protein